MDSIKYMTSLLTFYLKGEIKSEQNFISFKNPNTILGLIPLGSKKEKIAINQIASTETNFKLKFLKLLIGIGIACAGFACFASTLLGGLIILIIGANTIIDAFEIDLVVITTAGMRKEIDFFIFEKAKADLAEEQINNMISGRLDDTNNRQQTDRIIDAINNK